LYIADSYSGVALDASSLLGQKRSIEIEIYIAAAHNCVFCAANRLESPLETEPTEKSGHKVNIA
jgi:hypothetical protein